jgi:hypothetical protein
MTEIEIPTIYGAASYRLSLSEKSITVLVERMVPEKPDLSLFWANALRFLARHHTEISPYAAHFNPCDA